MTEALKQLNLFELQHKCTPDRGLEVQFGDEVVICPVEGGTVTVCVATPGGFLTGSIHCRPCKTVCSVSASYTVRCTLT